MSSLVSLQVVDVSVSYRGACAVEGVSVEVPGGTCAAIVGPAGAGKTSLLRAVVGLVPSCGGRIVLGGHDVSGLSAAGRARAGLGHGLHEGPTAGSTVGETVRRAAAATAGRDRSGVASTLALLPELAGAVDRPVSDLGPGERQLLSTGVALAGRPTVLVLDSPTSGLGPGLVERVVEAVRRVRDAGTTVLLVEHRVEVAAAVADEVYVMSRGRFSHRMRGDDPQLADSAHAAYLA